MLQLTRETVRYAIFLCLFIQIYYLKTARCEQTYSDQAVLTRMAFYAIFAFIAPFVVISFCYSKLVKALYLRSTVAPESNISEKELMRQRKQLLKMSLTVTLVFGACFFPATVTGFLRHFRPVSHTVRTLGLFLLAISSVVNPYIYALYSSNYRHAFKFLLKCK